jgi:fibronectin-binding autotransporter adhesin
MGLTRPRAAQIFDLDYKQATRVITVANVTLTGGAPAVVDGVSLVLGDRVLVTGQSTASQNGLYDVTVVGVGSDGTWARTSDGNATGEILAGMIVMVTEGTLYADTQWKLTTDNPIIIGTTGLTFVINILSSVGGANTQVQVNDGGTLAGFSNFVFDKTSNILSVTGNISGNYFLGNGSQLTGIAGAYGNTEVAAYLSSGNVTTAINTTSTISATGNITGGNVISGGARAYKWTTQANTAPSNAVPGDNWYDSYADKLYLYINDGTGNQWVDQSSPATFDSLNVIGNTASGNLLTTGQVSAAGNITGNYFLGNGALLTGVITSVANINSGTSNVTVVSSGGNITVGVGGTANVVQFATTGAFVTGVVSATGNVSGGNLNVTGNIVDTGALTIITGASGNVTLAPNGTSVVVATTTGANIAGTLNATGNGIIAGRDLAIGGNSNNWTTSGRGTVAITGTSDAILGLQIGASGTGYLYSTLTDMSLYNVRSGSLVLSTNSGGGSWSITSTGIFSGTGNVQGGNLRTAGQISATGNITGGNVLGGANVNATIHTGTTVSVTGNVTGGNLLISGSISDSAQLDINTTAGNANIVLTPNGTGNVNTGANVSVTGNITSGNLITGGGSGGNITGANVISANTVTVTANVTGGNILTGGLISVTGNITGGNLLISGAILDSAQLDIQTTAGNANIVLTPNGTGNVNISANIMPTANATANIGSATSSFNTVFAMATSAQYADLAEMYEADAAYAPGTVLEFGGDKEVTISNTPFSPLIVGVVSTNPAYLMNSTAQGKYMAAIALVGRVPTQVIGPVSKGAMMISAGEGRAKACAAPVMGTVIGKALQDHPGGPGMIEIVVGRL